MSPFFQHYASECCGASPSTVGIIFAALPFTSFVATVLLGNSITKVGPRPTLMGGLLLLAGSSLGFGLSASVVWFLVWRVIQGVSSALVYVSISTTMAQTFSDQQEFTYVNGLQEVLGNLGFVVAPALGGILYDWGGFFAPFGVSAVGHVVFVALTAMPKCGSNTQPADQQNKLLDSDAGPLAAASLRDIWSKPVMQMAVAAAILPALFGFFEPLAAIHFTTVLGLPPGSGSGLLLAAPAVSSTLCTVAVPMLVKRHGGVPIIACGLAILGIVCVIFGSTDPSAAAVSGGLMSMQGMSTTSMWGLQIACMLFLGLGSALAWTPVLPQMLANTAELVEESDTAGAAATVFNAAAALGEALGPVCGGLLSSIWGFAGATVIPGLFALGYALTLFTNRPPLQAIQMDSPNLEQQCSIPHPQQKQRICLNTDRETTLQRLVSP